MVRNIFIGLILALTLVNITGCGSDGSYTSNGITLPTDSFLTLYCDNVGIDPEKCILNDPANPYRFVAIETDPAQKDAPNYVFTMSESAPSAKSRFYLWATALAKTSTGDFQFQVATALHQLYTEGKSDTARRQAFKAYSTVLGNSNFRGSSTYWKATWLTSQPTYAVPVKDLTGMRLYDPRLDNLLTLFPNTISDPALSLSQSQFDGLHKLGDWRCAYDPNPNPLTKIGTLKP
jgi:hypothetical protein